MLLKKNGGERGIRTIASLDITLTYGLLVAIAASLATVAKAPWPILAQRVLGRQMVLRHQMTPNEPGEDSQAIRRPCKLLK